MDASALTEAVVEVAREDRDGWSGAARSQRLLELLEARDRLDAEVLCLVGEWDARRDWAEDGALNPASWLAHRAPVTKADALRMVRSARLARAHERTAKSLAAGDVSAAHVDVIATAVRHREELYADHEDTLLDAAMTLPPEAFRTAARTWRTLADDTLAAEDAYDVFEHRRVHASSTFRGSTVMDAEFDTDGGATVLAALRAYDEGPSAISPDGTPLTLSQRYHDAMVAICGHALSCRTPKGRPPTGMDVIVDVERLIGGPLGDLANARCDLTGVGPISAETARRLACDAAVGRALTNGASEILDLGRRNRLISAAQRRALDIRDRGCAFPGCDRPPWWCDGHHLDDWADGGCTDLDRLLLLCRRHHVLVHEGGWTLRREADGSIVAIPP